jgi:hypothetical protein
MKGGRSTSINGSNTQRTLMVSSDATVTMFKVGSHTARTYSPTWTMAHV